MSKTLIEKIEMQINHAKDCMDADGTKKGFIQGLEFVKNVLLPEEKQKNQRIAELEKLVEAQEQIITGETKEMRLEFLKNKETKSFQQQCTSCGNIRFITVGKNAEEKIEYECDSCVIKKQNQHIKKLEKENETLLRISEKNRQKISEVDKWRLELQKENAELKQKLENAIVPKFKVGDEIWIIKRIKKEVANGKIIKKYLYFNGGTPENLRNENRWRIRLKNNSEVTKKEYELFYTREEAEEALKKLEEK